MLTQWL